MNKILRYVMLAMVFLCGVAIAVSTLCLPTVVLKCIVGGEIAALTGIFLGYVQDKTFPLVRERASHKDTVR